MPDPVPMNSFADRLTELEERLTGILIGGGGGGTSAGMEARVAKLEAHIEHVRSDLAKLANLPESVGRVEERLTALPDKDWVGTKMRNWIGGVGTVLGVLMVALKYIG